MNTLRIVRRKSFQNHFLLFAVLLIAAVTQALAVSVEYKLPYPGGESYRVSQGNNSSYSHTGVMKYAFDFAMHEGFDVVAAAAGEVVLLKEDSDTSCDDEESCGNDANYVVIKHTDGYRSVYLHLQYQSVIVRKGQTVAQGQPIAKSGKTGWATAAHLHFHLQEQGGGSWYEQSVPISFSDVAGGVPIVEQYYTSDNYYNSTKFTVNDYVQTTGLLNIREGPGLSSNKITPPSPLPLGAKGQVLPNENNGVYQQSYYWWYVKFGDYVGWCSEHQLESSTEILYTTPPTVNAFSVGPDSVVLGRSFTISYRISDTGGSGLNWVQLWRATDTNGDGEPDWPDTYVEIYHPSGQTNFSGVFFDRPPSVGTYWYGVHVGDNNGKWSVEPDPPGPIKVTVK